MRMVWIYLCAFVYASASMGTLPAWGVGCAFVWVFIACNEKWKAGRK